jgi:hypothetical protein
VTYCWSPGGIGLTLSVALSTATKVVREWYSRIRPGSRVGEVGLLVVAIGLLIGATVANSSASGEL